MYTKIIQTLSAIMISFLISGCAPSQPNITSPTYNPYTPGVVSLTLKKGITTQAEVLQSFGAPNIVSQNSDGNEVWTYQKNATVSQANSSGSYITILLAGANHDSSGFAQSSRTMTLIIYFNKAQRVVDFKSLTTSF